MSDTKCTICTNETKCELCVSALIQRVEDKYESKLKPLRDVYEKYKKYEEAFLSSKILVGLAELWQALKNLFDKEEGK